MTVGLLELGEITVISAQRRLDAISQNVANITTPGYRKTNSFQSAIAAGASPLQTASDFSAGALRATGRPLDLALTSEGFFAVQGEGGVYYTRAGHFTRDADGRLIDAQGLALQSIDGGDIVLASSNVEILDDGVVLEDGTPIARIGVFSLTTNAVLQRVSGAYFQAAPDAMIATGAPTMRQGMVEGSNVDLPVEMIAMMQTLRQAEVGARIVQTYDSLLGQTISTLGRVRG